MPSCEQCMQADEACLQKVRGPRCQHCVHRKVRCSLVRMKQRVDKKESKQRLVLEGRFNGSHDGANRWIHETDGGHGEGAEKNRWRKWALVKGVGKLTEVMEQSEKMGTEKAEKEVETEIIQKVDKGMKMEIFSEKESEDNSEEEKEEDKKGNGDKEMDGDEEN
jgi:copper chaperone CopZ